MPDKSEQEKFYEAANRKIEAEEQSNKQIQGCAALFFGVMALLIGGIVILSIIGVLWTAVFGPSG